MGDTITVDITPSWVGILPVIRDADANMRRKLAATSCDGFEDGWCSVHNRVWDEDAAKARGCEWNREPAADRNRWRRELEADLAANERSFTAMARGADRYNRIARAYRAFQTDHDDTAFHETLFAILTEEQK